jgi:thioester reductase-like protein
MGRVPVAILRPSIIIGDSRSGEVDPLDRPYTLILLILNAPAKAAVTLPVRADIPLNLVPIDYVVRATHAISHSPLAVGRTFHLVDPSPLPAGRAFELMAYAAGKRSTRGAVPSYLTRALLRAPGLERIVRSPKAFLQLLTSPVRYDATNAEAVLRGTGILCPPFESYVDRIVAHVQQHIRERRRVEAYQSEEAYDPLS